MNETYTSKNSYHLMSFHSSIVFLIINVLGYIMMCYFNWLINEMVKREEKRKEVNMLNRILLFYAFIMPVMMSFFIVFVNVLFSFIHPVSEVLGESYCYAFKLLAHMGVVYVGILSLITSIIRYCAIRRKSPMTPKEQGNRKMVFLLLHCLIPPIVSFLNFLTSGVRDGTFWVDRCWGIEETDHSQANEEDGLTFIKEKFCYNNEYSIVKYVGVSAAETIESLLRSLCGGVRLIYLTYMTNVIECFIYLYISRRINRSYHRRKIKFPCVDGKLRVARKQRCRNNKILIALDFLAETVSNLCQMVVYLIPSNDPIFQYVAFSLWVLNYSFLIPMSYLLNEKRVKDIVIEKGWIEGIKAVFHSSKKIRQLQILSHQETELCPKEQPNLHSIDNLAFSTTNHVIDLHRNRKSIYGKETNNGSPKQDTSSRIELNYLSKSDIKEQNQIKVMKSQCNGNSFKNVDGISDEEFKFNYERKMSDFQTMDSNTEEVDNEESFPLIITKEEQQLDVMKAKQFNVFARQYILQRILHVLYSEKDDTKYGVYKKYLLNVEECSLEVNQRQHSNDLFVALINAYHLHSHSNLLNHEVEPNISSMSWQTETQKHDNWSIEPNFQKDIDVINSMILFVGEEQKYHEYLNILCDMN